MNTMVTHTGARQVYESYTVTVTYEVRAFRDDWDDDGWLKESSVLECFKEEFSGDDIDAVGLEANVSDYKIVRDV